MSGTLHVEPGLAAGLSPPGGDAGEMIGVGGDQRRPALLRHDVLPVAACESRARELGRDQSIVGRQRGVVLYEYSRLAGAARTRPHDMAAEEALADVAAMREELRNGRAGHLAVGAPVVEGFHQRALADDGQFGQRERTLAQMRPGVAVERRACTCEADQRVAPRVGRRGDRRPAQGAHPQRLRGQRRGAPLIDGGTQRIRGRRLESWSHDAV